MIILTSLDTETGESRPVTAAVLRNIGYESTVVAEFYRDMLVELQKLLLQPIVLPPEVAAIFEVLNYDDPTTADSGPVEADLREQSEWLFARFGLLGSDRSL